MLISTGELTVEDLRRLPSGRWAIERTIRQTAPNTFAVTEPGTKKVVTISGPRPATVGTAQLWVITRISSS
jgi:hypothetical protein